MFLHHSDVLVIGGSSAGLSAAITAKRQNPQKNVTLLRKEKQTLVSCGIPYVFGVVGSPEKNLMPVDALLSKNKIDSLVAEVTSIDKEQRTVAVSSGEQVGYEQLIIATGSEPIVPPIPGVEKENIYAVRKDVPYLQKVIASMEKIDSICIVGCGRSVRR